MHSAAGQMRKNQKVAVITALALLMSVLFTAALLLILDGKLMLKPLVIATVCSVAISMPISQFVLNQTDKLEQAHSDLTAAHGQLAVLYRELEDAHREMEFKARHDAMTGLLNRAAFMTGFDGRRRNSSGGYMLMIDADRFKQINDTHGHDTGDRVLVAIAEVLQAVTRKDDICSRIGGEEFAVYLPGSTYQDALQCGERLRKSVADQRVTTSTGEVIGVTISIGAAPFGAGQSIDDLMRAADRLLYKAKSEGRNRVCASDTVTKAA